MKIDTLRFGEVEVDDNLIFDFVMPVIGFDSLSKFVIIDSNKEALFKWLQSAEDPSLAFPIISVAGLDYDYSVELSDSVVETLGIESADDILIMNITSIPQENPHGTTINLLAPLVFNLKNQKAAQIVLSGSGYDISYPMFKKV